jgi:hypothetical protein
MTTFVTRSGAKYHVYTEAMTFFCERPNEETGSPLRVLEGTILEMSTIEVGRSVEFICQPITPGTNARYIRTTGVVHIEK